MEDFYVSDHKIDMKIKIKYIYNTQVTCLFCLFFYFLEPTFGLNVGRSSKKFCS